jgi:hypothetical protein
MALTTLTGTVTGIRHSTETVGQIGTNGGSVQTGQLMAFRVDERSAQIKLKDMPDLRDGERVTLAGRAKNGTFRALALRNDQTRAVYATAAWPGYVMGGIMVALGIPLSLMIIGLPFLVIGLYTLYQAFSYAKAEKMLRG